MEKGSSVGSNELLRLPAFHWIVGPFFQSRYGTVRITAPFAIEGRSLLDFRDRVAAQLRNRELPAGEVVEATEWEIIVRFQNHLKIDAATEQGYNRFRAWTAMLEFCRTTLPKDEADAAANALNQAVSIGIIQLSVTGQSANVRCELSSRSVYHGLLRPESVANSMDFNFHSSDDVAEFAGRLRGFALAGGAEISVIFV